MPIRGEDLPLAMRKKLGIHTPSKKSRAGVGDSAPCPYLCVACGRRFETYLEAQDHSLVEGHSRLQMIL